MDPFDPYPSLGDIHADLTEYEHSLDEPDSKDVLAEPEDPRPLPSFLALVVIIAGLLLLRLFDLQIVKGTTNRVLAEGNLLRTRDIPSARGEILDRHGQTLASNTVTYSLELYPAELPRQKSQRDALFATVAQTTGLDLTEAKKELTNLGLTSLDPIILTDQVPRETALLWEVQLADLPGVLVAKIPERTYASIPGLGHILGYVGRLTNDDHTRYPDLPLSSIVGKTGLEATYESDLHGQAGQDRIEVDAKGRVERTLAQQPAVPGQTLVLTIDQKLQASLMQHLAEGAAKEQSAQAAAVALDPKTGEILAMASLPDFDPNAFVQSNRTSDRAQLLTDQNQPLFNRAIAGTYPSGSTIKPVLATAGLSEGVIDTKTRLDTSAGVIQIGQFRFPDWKVHGLTDVKQAIAESNDIFFYAVGGGYQQITGLGVSRMKTWLEKFGFGSSTGIDLPGEAKGLVPDEQWKKQRIGENWYIGDSYHLAIGQGFFLTTPLQLVTATAAIANGGDLLKPHLLFERRAHDGSVLEMTHKEVNRSTIASNDYLQIVRDGMRQTVTDGTARSLGELSVPAAGKTGTAQFGKDNKTHSWFVGYAPADDPQIVLAVIVEGGGESTDAAVPVAKAFLKDWIDQRQAPPPAP